ncbi:MAG: type II secretion system F family protein [Lachnospiraceae bacterium]|nr:type II secretion system F family protein [Lachnospiraceae bacterium]
MNSKFRLEPKDRVICVITYLLLSCTASWLFYDEIYAAIVFAPGFWLFTRAVKGMKSRKYDEELTDEFMKTLISVSTSLAAGISPENAFAIAGTDMEKLYGKRSAIARELGMINTQVAMGKRLTEALYDLAKRTRIPEIYDFAVVFSVAKDKGANFSAVISSCVSVMDDRRRAQCEAKVLIRAKQYEQRVMCIIPPGILVYLKFSSGSFIGVLYHNSLGITVMSICLAVYVFSVCLSEKIGDVKV